MKTISIVSGFQNTLSTFNSFWKDLPTLGKISLLLLIVCQTGSWSLESLLDRPARSSELAGLGAECMRVNVRYTAKELTQMTSMAAVQAYSACKKIDYGPVSSDEARKKMEVIQKIAKP